MSKKQLIIIIIATFGFLILFSAGIYLLYLFAPQTLGLPSKSANRVSYKDIKTYIDPKIIISKQQYDDWQRKVLDAELKLGDNSFLSKQNILLNDSLKKTSKKLAEYSIHEIKSKDSTKTIPVGKKPNDSLSILNQQISKLKNEITSLNNTLQNQKKTFETKQDSLYDSNLIDFAKIYENSSPSEIAKIIELLNYKDAAKILKNMSKKKAGKIIELLKPVKADSILRNGRNK